MENKKEQIEKAIKILANHNKWRKGGDNEMSEPKDLTFAIDTVIEALSQPKEVEPKKEVDLDELKDSYIELCKKYEASSVIKIWNFFLPHLQKPVESKCDGIAFMDWYNSVTNEFIPVEDNMYRNMRTDELLTATELYEQFKQLKK